MTREYFDDHGKPFGPGEKQEERQPIAMDQGRATHFDWRGAVTSFVGGMLIPAGMFIVIWIIYCVHLALAFLGYW